MQRVQICRSPDLAGPPAVSPRQAPLRGDPHGLASSELLRFWNTVGAAAAPMPQQRQGDLAYPRRRVGGPGDPSPPCRQLGPGRFPGVFLQRGLSQANPCQNQVVQNPCLARIRSPAFRPADPPGWRMPPAGLVPLRRVARPDGPGRRKPGAFGARPPRAPPGSSRRPG